MSLASGKVTALARWPVKSMGGETVETLQVSPDGVAGDRAHALWDVHRGERRQLTARQAPRLLAWGATYGGADLAPGEAPAPALTAPGGESFSWDDPQLHGVLGEDLGREVQLTREPAGQQDLLRSVLITTQATHDAIEAELGRPLDPRRWRTNVHVVLDDAEAFAEEGWERFEVQVGEVRFAALHPCVRCVIPTRDPDTQEKDARLLRHLTREHGGLFGLNLRAVGAGRIAVGDSVSVTG